MGAGGSPWGCSRALVEGLERAGCWPVVQGEPAGAGGL